MNKSLHVSDQLRTHYNWNKFTFGAEVGSADWQFRYLISCIIVGGNNEADTLRAADQVFLKYGSISELANASWRELTDLLQENGIKYEGNKAKFILATSKEIERLGAVPNTRDGLEALPGVGRHVASVMLATVFGQNEFAVDIHVRRIAGRLGLVPEKATDLAIEKAVKAAIPAEQWGHFSRSFVDFGQTICTLNPKCGSCMLNKDCNAVTTSSLKTTGVKVSKVDGVYPVSAYRIQVNNGYAKCNCVAGKFGRACKHVKML